MRTLSIRMTHSCKSRGQRANPGLPGEWLLKPCVCSHVDGMFFFILCVLGDFSAGNGEPSTAPGAKRSQVSEESA